MSSAELLHRRAHAGADIVEVIDGLRPRGADVGLRAVADVDEVVGLTAVAVERRRFALIDAVEKAHDDGDIGAEIVLARPVDVHVAQPHIGQPVTVAQRAPLPRPRSWSHRRSSCC